MRAVTPLVWVLQGLKAGDNAQARELAARLPARTELKTLRYNWLCRLPNYMLGEGLASVSRGTESLSAPWPDLVIGIGRRSVPVARWIRRQSGGQTRLVHMGRPRARTDIFDLVVTTPQYGLPPAPNVIELALPLVSETPLPDAELDFWRKEFADLPRPLITVLVGGPSRPYRMQTSDMSELIEAAEELRKRLGGSLIVVGSPRTPKDAFEDRAQAFGVKCRLFGWAAGKLNPYRAALRLADRFIVTSDSVSMLAEALRTDKPVDVYRLPMRKSVHLPLGNRPLAELVRRGLVATRRDVPSFVSKLIAERHVGVLGEGDFTRQPIPREEERVVELVRALLPQR